MGIAVLLALHLLLGRYGHSAAAAAQQAAVRGGRAFDLRHSGTFVQDGVRPVVQFLGDRWFVYALIYLSGIAEVAVVERVLEHEGHAGDMDAVLVPRYDAGLLEQASQVLQPYLASRVCLEQPLHKRGVLAVDDDGLGYGVVHVPERR